MNLSMAQRLIVGALVSCSLPTSAGEPIQQGSVVSYARPGTTQQVCARVWSVFKEADGVDMAWVVSLQPPAWVNRVPVAVLHLGCEGT